MIKPKVLFFLSLLLLTAFIPALKATTFIIQDGDVEVGRYTEDDGQDIVNFIQKQKGVTARDAESIQADKEAADREFKKRTGVKKDINTMLIAFRYHITVGIIIFISAYIAWKRSKGSGLI